MEIALHNIGKRYETNWIFRGISTSFQSGNIYGITGHNGSGKSTLLQIISGFVTPTEGTINYDNGSIAVEEIYKYCSIATPYLELPHEFTVKETVVLQEKFKPFQPGMDSQTVISLCGLEAHQNKSLQKLSSGMLQRLKLALAIAADSQVLLLDEPCANLDSTWTAWFNNTLNQTRQNRIVVICSNDPERELKSAIQILDLESVKY
ncbi:MAG: ATP-binding cassette domain-containing protein [Flavobacteriales bacterium]